MRSRVLSIAALGLALTVPVLGAAVTAPTADAAGKVAIELDCDGEPEVTKITNKSGKDLEVRTLGSLVDPSRREPFKVDETLKKGETLKLESGEKARGGNVLTKQELYDDESDREGVVIRTSAGTFTEKCD